MPPESEAAAGAIPLDDDGIASILLHREFHTVFRIYINFEWFDRILFLPPRPFLPQKQIGDRSHQAEEKDNEQPHPAIQVAGARMAHPL
jgi:hypothetical protein